MSVTTTGRRVRARSYLMCAPDHFRVEYAINPWMPERRLELEARANPAGSARIAFKLIPWSEDTLVILDEHPLEGLGARLQGPVSELLLHVRNRRILSSLARVAVEDRGT